MSDAHNEHESGIKTPKQLAAAIVAAFIVPIVIIVLLVQYVTTERHDAAFSGLTPDEVKASTAARIKPVADEGFTLKDINAPRQLQTGAEVYKAVCAACHDTGAAGSPKLGDSAGWSARIAQGYDKLVANALNGIRAMPARGGNPDLDDVEVARAVVHMANQGGAKFKEPEVKAPAAASAPASSAPAEPAPAALPAK